MKVRVEKFWSPYSDKRVAEAARKDAESSPPIPDWNETKLCPFVFEIKDYCENGINDVAREWALADSKLKTNWLHALRAKELNEEQTNLAAATEREATSAYTNHYGEAPPAGHSVKGILGYWVLIALLFIFEFPMNAIVFRLFGENEIFTYVATAAIALSLLAAAHLLGAFSRQGGLLRDRKRLLICIGMIFLALFVIAAVAYFREIYIAQFGGDLGHMSPSMLWIGFGAFNLVIFVVATSFSYWVHDEFLLRVMRARKEFLRAEKAQGHSVDWCAKAQSEREKAFASNCEVADQITQHCQRLRNLYSRHNLQTRNDREGQSGGMPASFTCPLEIDIPKSLKELDWHVERPATKLPRSGVNNP